MKAASLATIYACLTTLPAAMHVLLAAGAPLGRFTVGGRFPGRLPVPWRALALLQAGLLGGMAAAVLDRAGVIDVGIPAALFWTAVGLTLVTFIANAVSPSRPERLLWTPVIAAMSATAVGVGFA